MIFDGAIDKMINIGYNPVWRMNMKTDPSKPYIIACKNVKGQNSAIAIKIAELLEYYSKNSKMAEPSREERSSMGRKIRNMLRKYATIGGYCNDTNRINYCFIKFDIPEKVQQYLIALHEDMQMTLKKEEQGIELL